MPRSNQFYIEHCINSEINPNTVLHIGALVCTGAHDTMEFILYRICLSRLVLYSFRPLQKSLNMIMLPYAPEINLSLWILKYLIQYYYLALFLIRSMTGELQKIVLSLIQSPSFLSIRYDPDLFYTMLAS